MISRVWMPTPLVDVARTIWSETPKVTIRVNFTLALSFRCWFLGHEDCVRCAPGRLFLKCIECGRETPGWKTEKHFRASR